jgi:hypothetical protein
MEAYLRRSTRDDDRETWWRGSRLSASSSLSEAKDLAAARESASLAQTAPASSSVRSFAALKDDEARDARMEHPGLLTLRDEDGH